MNSNSVKVSNHHMTLGAAAWMACGSRPAISNPDAPSSEVEFASFGLEPMDSYLPD